MQASSVSTYEQEPTSSKQGQTQLCNLKVFEEKRPIDLNSPQVFTILLISSFFYKHSQSAEMPPQQNLDALKHTLQVAPKVKPPIFFFFFSRETAIDTKYTIPIFDRQNFKLQKNTFQHSHHHHQLCILTGLNKSLYAALRRFCVFLPSFRSTGAAQAHSLFRKFDNGKWPTYTHPSPLRQQETFPCTRTSVFLKHEGPKMKFSTKIP